MGKTKDSRKNNSKKYKSQVKKDMQKKMQEKADKRKKIYSDISGGSKVVKHGKSAVNAAPYYYGGKITRGGYGHYGHYYPYQEGVLDKQMSKLSMVENAFRKQKAATAWQVMYQQGMSGELDDIPDETKKKIMEVQRDIEKQHRKEKLIKEYTQKKKKLEDLTNANVGLLKGHSNLYRKDKDGNIAISKSSTIRDEIAAVDKNTQQMNKKTKIIHELNDATDKQEKAGSLLQVQRKEAREKYKDDKELIAIIDDEEKLKAEVMRRNRLVHDMNENTKEYDDLIRRKKEYEEAQRKLELLHAELTAKTGWEDADIAGAIADVIRRHGSPEDMRAKIDEILAAAEKRTETLKEQYETYRTKQEELAKNFDYYGVQMKNIKDNLTTFFENTKFVNAAFKRQMYTKSIDELFSKADELQDYIPKEIHKQHEKIKNKYARISKLASIINKNEVDLIGPANDLIEKLREIAELEAPEYAEMMNDSVSTEVMSPEDEEQYARECVVVEGGDSLRHLRR